MNNFIFIDKGPGKKNYTKQSHGSVVWDLNDSDEDSTKDIKLLFLSIRILCIILNLKKKQWRKEWKRYATRKKTWTFWRQ
jgi:predicted KAP-like P-loop ATPase